MKPRRLAIPQTALLLGALIAQSAPVAAQTPISACGTVFSGSYVLDRDLESDGNCLVLAADDIAIDFRGHTIRGDGSDAAVTDGFDSLSNVILFNGRILGFNHGIRLDGSDNVTVSRMDVSENETGGIWIGGDNNHLSWLRTDDNSFDGVFIGGCCSVVTNSSATGNNGSGFALDGGSSSLVDSRGKDNESNGARMEGGDNEVVGVSFSVSVGSGIELRNGNNFVADAKTQTNGTGVVLLGDANQALDVQTGRNRNDGFRFDGSSNLIADAKATKNGETGFLFDLSPGNNLTGVQAKSNGEGGVEITCPGNVLDLKAKGNDAGDFVATPGTCNELGADPIAIDACGNLPSGSYELAANLEASGDCPDDHGGQGRGGSAGPPDPG